MNDSSILTPRSSSFVRKRPQVATLSQTAAPPAPKKPKLNNEMLAKPKPPPKDEAKKEDPPSVRIFTGTTESVLKFIRTAYDSTALIEIYGKIHATKRGQHATETEILIRSDSDARVYRFVHFAIDFPLPSLNKDTPIRAVIRPMPDGRLHIMKISPNPNASEAQLNRLQTVSNFSLRRLLNQNKNAVVN